MTFNTAERRQLQGIRNHVVLEDSVAPGQYVVRLPVRVVIRYLNIGDNGPYLHLRRALQAKRPFALAEQLDVVGVVKSHQQ